MSSQAMTPQDQDSHACASADHSHSSTVPKPEQGEAVFKKCLHCTFHSSNTEELASHMQLHGKAPNPEHGFHCKGCPYTTDDKVPFQEHVSLHFGDSPPVVYTCQECQAQTTEVAKVESHNKEEHPGSYPIPKHDATKIDIVLPDWQCTFCGIKFFTKRMYLVVHLHKIHQLSQNEIKEMQFETRLVHSIKTEQPEIKREDVVEETNTTCRQVELAEHQNRGNCAGTSVCGNVVGIAAATGERTESALQASDDSEMETVQVTQVTEQTGIHENVDGHTEHQNRGNCAGTSVCGNVVGIASATGERTESALQASDDSEMETVQVTQVTEQTGIHENVDGHTETEIRKEQVEVVAMNSQTGISDSVSVEEHMSSCAQSLVDAPTEDLKQYVCKWCKHDSNSLSQFFQHLREHKFMTVQTLPFYRCTSCSLQSTSQNFLQSHHQCSVKGNKTAVNKTKGGPVGSIEVCGDKVKVTFEKCLATESMDMSAESCASYPRQSVLDMYSTGHENRLTSSLYVTGQELQEPVYYAKAQPNGQDRLIDHGEDNLMKEEPALEEDCSEGGERHCLQDSGTETDRDGLPLNSSSASIPTTPVSSNEGSSKSKTGVKPGCLSEATSAALDHIKTVGSGKKKKYKCTVCLQSMSNLANAKRHVINKHLNQAKEESKKASQQCEPQDCSESDSVVEVGGTKPFKCRWCRFTAKEKYTVQYHALRAHPQDKDMASKQTRLQTANLHLRVSENKAEVPSKRLSAKTGKKVQFLTSAPGKASETSVIRSLLNTPVACAKPVESREQPSTNLSKSHMSNNPQINFEKSPKSSGSKEKKPNVDDCYTKSGETSKPYVCKECKHMKKHRHQMREHVILVHWKQHPYACPYCPKKGVTREKMRKHCTQKHAKLTLKINVKMFRSHAGHSPKKKTESASPSLGSSHVQGEMSAKQNNTSMQMSVSHVEHTRHSGPTKNTSKQTPSASKHVSKKMTTSLGKAKKQSINKHASNKSASGGKHKNQNENKHSSKVPHTTSAPDESHSAETRRSTRQSGSRSSQDSEHSKGLLAKEPARSTEMRKCFQCPLCQYKTNCTEAIRKHISGEIGYNPYHCTQCGLQNPKEIANRHYKVHKNVDFTVVKKFKYVPDAQKQAELRKLMKKSEVFVPRENLKFWKTTVTKGEQWDVFGGKKPGEDDTLEDMDEEEDAEEDTADDDPTYEDPTSEDPSSDSDWEDEPPNRNRTRKATRGPTRKKRNLSQWLYQCPLCPYSTTDRVGMKGHAFTEIGGKPFKCTICSFSGAKSGNVVNHFKVHHRAVRVPHKHMFVRQLTDEKMKEIEAFVENNRKSLNTTEDMALSQTETGPGDTTAVGSVDTFFQCPKCSFQTPSKDGIETHLLDEMGCKPYRCTLCSYNASRCSKVTKHFKTAHRTNTSEHMYTLSSISQEQQQQLAELLQQAVVSKSSGPLIPPKGNANSSNANQTQVGASSPATVPRGRKKRPWKSWTNLGYVFRSYHCPLCPHKSQHRRSMELHIMRDLKYRPFHCRSCTYRSAKKTDVKEHFKNIHPGQEYQELTLRDPNIDAEVKRLLIDSEKAETKEAAEEEDVQISLGAVKGFVPRWKSNVSFENVDKIYECVFCQLKTKTRNVMRDHLCREIQYRPFKCTLCNYRATQSHPVRTHIKNHHPNTDCSYVKFRDPKKEAQVEKLLKQTEREPGSSIGSTGKVIFWCSICYYKTEKQSLIEQHMKRELEDKSYKCSACNFYSALESGVQLHFRAKHPDAPCHCIVLTEKQKVAEVKRLVEESRTYEKTGMAVAENLSDSQSDREEGEDHDVSGNWGAWKCVKCGYKTKQRADIVNHMRGEVGYMPYKCDYCDFRSASRTAIRNNHWQIYHAEKPFRTKYFDLVVLKKKVEALVRRSLVVPLAVDTPQEGTSETLTTSTAEESESRLSYVPFRRSTRQTKKFQVGTDGCENSVGDMSSVNLSDSENLSETIAAESVTGRPSEKGEGVSKTGTDEKKVDGASGNTSEIDRVGKDGNAEKVSDKNSCDTETAAVDHMAENEAESVSGNKPNREIEGKEIALDTEVAENEDQRPLSGVLDAIQDPYQPLETNYIQQSSPVLQCVLCTYRGTSVTRLRIHLMKELKYKPHKCTACKYCSVKRGTVVQHYRKMHDEEGEEGQSMYRPDKKKADKIEELIRRIQAGTQETEFSDSVTPQETGGTQQKNKPKQKRWTPYPNKGFWRCCNCATEFKLHSSITWHIQREMNYLPYQCAYCKFHATHHRDLFNHHWKVYHKDKPFDYIHHNDESKNEELAALVDKSYIPPTDSSNKKTKASTDDATGETPCKKARLEASAAENVMETPTNEAQSGDEELQEEDNYENTSEGKSSQTNSSIVNKEMASPERAKTRESAGNPKTSDMETPTTQSEQRSGWMAKFLKNANTLYRCVFCEYTSKFSQGIKMHVMRELQYKPYKCSACKYVSVRADPVKQHNDVVHSGKGKCNFLPDQKKEAKLSEVMAKIEEAYKNERNVNLKKQDSTVNRKGQKQQKTCSGSNTVEKQTTCSGSCHYKPVVLRKVVWYPYRCATCDFACMTGKQLEEHIKKKLDYNPYYCCICDFKAIKLSKMKWHFTLDHPDEEFDYPNYQHVPSKEKLAQVNKLLEESKALIQEKPNQTEVSDNMEGAKKPAVKQEGTVSEDAPHGEEIPDNSTITEEYSVNAPAGGSETPEHSAVADADGTADHLPVQSSDLTADAWKDKRIQTWIEESSPQKKTKAFGPGLRWFVTTQLDIPCFKCGFCSFRAMFPSEVVRHKLTAHPSSKFKIQKMSKQQRKIKVRMLWVKFKNAKQHLCTAGRSVTSIQAGKKFRKSLNCSECTFRTTRVAVLHCHLVIHGAPRFVCQGCGLKSRYKNVVQHHIRRQHRGSGVKYTRLHGPVRKEHGRLPWQDKLTHVRVRELEDTESSSGCSTTSREYTDVKPGDLVWAKLGRYPWWPSIVYNHPTANTYKKGGKKPMFHVQFFDDPPSRAWVKAKYVAEYRGSRDPEFKRGGRFYHSSSDLKWCVHQADQAMTKSCEERMKLIVWDTKQ